MADRQTVEGVARELFEECQEWASARGYGWFDCPSGEATAVLARFILRREARVVKEALGDALELIDELRGYAADWDWKYGEAWDSETAKLRRLASEVKVDGE